MERTNEFLDFATQIPSSSVRINPARKPSVLVEKAVATVRKILQTMPSSELIDVVHSLLQYRQIESFERLLHECRDGFVNYHRYCCI